MIMQWREIHHNFFMDNYSPQEDVDNDGASVVTESARVLWVYCFECWCKVTAEVLQSQ
jgi:hypothetical protein